MGASRKGSPARGTSSGPEQGSSQSPAERTALGGARRSRGLTAHHGGLAAEDVVARFYASAGLALLETRWRGEAGEIDLVLRDGDGLVFVEVKQARTHDGAARSLTPRQAARILATATEYLGTQPRGQLTDTRIDLALVDRSGRVEVVENALGF